MRAELCTVVLALSFAGTAMAAEPVELGPKGGRLLALNPERSGYAEVTSENNSFYIELLDRDLKPVVIDQQTLTAVGGERRSPQRLPVETRDNRFVTPVPAGEEVWMLLQIKPSAGARKFRVRFHHDLKPCDTCKQPSWLCSCAASKSNAEGGG